MNSIKIIIKGAPKSYKSTIGKAIKELLLDHNIPTTFVQDSREETIPDLSVIKGTEVKIIETTTQRRYVSE